MGRCPISLSTPSGRSHHHHRRPPHRSAPATSSWSCASSPACHNERSRAIGTSQPTLATIETGNRVPTIRTLLRVADATGFELVIGLRRPNIPASTPTALHAQGFDLLGTLKPNPQDGLADFVVLREPSPLEGPR